MLDPLFIVSCAFFLSVHHFYLFRLLMSTLSSTQSFPQLDGKFNGTTYHECSASFSSFLMSWTLPALLMTHDHLRSLGKVIEWDNSDRRAHGVISSSVELNFHMQFAKSLNFASFMNSYSGFSSSRAICSPMQLIRCYYPPLKLSALFVIFLHICRCNGIC